MGTIYLITAHGKPQRAAMTSESAIRMVKDKLGDSRLYSSMIAYGPTLDGIYTCDYEYMRLRLINSGMIRVKATNELNGHAETIIIETIELS